MKRTICSSLVFFFRLPCLSKNKRVLVVAWIQAVRGNHLNISFSKMRSHILKTNLGSKFILDRVSGKTKHVDHHVGADLESTQFLVDTKEQSDNRWCYSLERKNMTKIKERRQKSLLFLGAKLDWFLKLIALSVETPPSCSQLLPAVYRFNSYHYQLSTAKTKASAIL